jgi:hypothetical protein
MMDFGAVARKCARELQMRLHRVGGVEEGGEGGTGGGTLRCIAIDGCVRGLLRHLTQRRRHDESSTRQSQRTNNKRKLSSPHPFLNFVLLSSERDHGGLLRKESHQVKTKKWFGLKRLVRVPGYRRYPSRCEVCSMLLK